MNLDMNPEVPFQDLHFASGSECQATAIGRDRYWRPLLIGWDSLLARMLLGAPNAASWVQTVHVQKFGLDLLHFRFGDLIEPGIVVVRFSSSS